MSKLRLLLPLAAMMGLAPIFTASAAPVPSFFQQDSLKEVFLASSLTAKLPTKCGNYCDTVSTGGYLVSGYATFGCPDSTC
jgi:hypothetical protein